MTTLADSLKAIINDHYGDVDGGDKPSVIVNIIDARGIYYPATELIAVLLPVTTKRNQVTTSYANVVHSLKVRISTPTSDDRLKQIVDEVRAVILANAVSGSTLQFISDEEDLSDRMRQVFVMDLTVTLEQSMVPSSSAYDGFSATSHLHDGDTLELDGIDSDGGAFPFTTGGDITFNHNLVLPALATVDGIDISVHAANASAHHTRYTTAEAEAVIDAEIVNGQSIDNAIDALISTHNAADTHVAHSGVSISPGTGLAGGGTIAATRTLSLSFLGLESLADPGADRVVFWDESANALKWLTVSTGLSIADVTLTCSITQYTDALARAACLENDAYGAGWDTDVTHAPTQNAVYDKMNVLDGYLDQGVKQASTPTFGGLTINGAMVLNGAITGTTSLTFDLGSTVNEFSIDGTLAGNSDSAVPTEKAVKTYADAIDPVAHWHDTHTLQLDAVNSNGGAFSFSTTGAITFNQQLILTHAVAGMLDLNPANTGSQNVIDITPTAALVAGSTWRGQLIVTGALDPATGAACVIVGSEVNLAGTNSVDANATLFGFRVDGSTTDTEADFASYPAVKADAVSYYGYLNYWAGALGVTQSNFGIRIDWASVTRSANAPVLYGVYVSLPAVYTNFGANLAGYFSGGGESVSLCDGTYAIDTVGGIYSSVGFICATNAGLACTNTAMYLKTNTSAVICTLENDEVDRTANCTDATGLSVHYLWYIHHAAGSMAMLKDEILPADPIDLEKQFDMLQPRSFKWKHEGLDAKSTIGFIAEETPDYAKVAEEGVAKGINYDIISTLLVNKVKLLEKRIKILEAAK